MRALTVVALIVAFVAALAAGRALGDTARTEVPSRNDFATLDRNRDGQISRTEALADREVAKRFAEFDADKDGHLSEAEFILVREDHQKRVLHDALITARVRATLFAHKGIPSKAIGVRTYEGRVRLSGYVAAPEIVSRVGRVTKAVDGVRAVDNNIAVKGYLPE